MVKLAIRDDDMNYFTSVEDIEYVYRDFNGFPVSFAVIPDVIDVSTRGACSDTKGNTIPRFIGDNKKLVEWLRKKSSNNEADALLHGINHSYKIIGGGRYAEMEWRDGETDLVTTIGKKKLDLSELFNYAITCFVAPSNKITKRCLQAVEDNNLNFSGIIPLKFNERLTIRNLCQYVKRWIFRAVYGLPYPGLMKYSGHKEINACTLISYDYLVRMFNFCDKHDLPMAINVHYWSLRDNAEQLEMLRSFVMDYAIPRGALPTKLTDLFI